MAKSELETKKRYGLTGPQSRGMAPYFFTLLPGPLFLKNNY